MRASWFSKATRVLELSSLPMCLSLVAARGFAQAASASQAGIPRSPSRDEVSANLAAHSRDFDYLLGEWAFKGERHATRDGVFRFHGIWKATKAPEGPLITDEYRVIDDSGRTLHVTTSLRAYSPYSNAWSIVSVEPATGIIQDGKCTFDGKEMLIEQTYHGGPGRGDVKMRFHYYNIGPDHFSWRGDASTDGGKTWTENFQKIEVTRKRESTGSSN